MKKKKRKKIEWSKILCGLVAFNFGGFAVWLGVEYYKLSRLAIETGGSCPDPTLAVTAMSVVIGAILSYLLYQMGLKNSRNKYGIDENGQPFKSKIQVDPSTEEIEEEEEQ